MKAHTLSVVFSVSGLLVFGTLFAADNKAPEAGRETVAKPITEKERKKQEDKLRKELRTKERLARHEEEPSIYRLTLDTIDKPNLQLIMYPGKLADAKAKAGAMKVSPEAAPDDDTDTIGAVDDTKEPVLDPERDETLNILADLVDLSRGPKTASTNVKKSAEQRP